MPNQLINYLWQVSRQNGKAYLKKLSDWRKKYFIESVPDPNWLLSLQFEILRFRRSCKRQRSGFETRQRRQDMTSRRRWRQKTWRMRCRRASHRVRWCTRGSNLRNSKPISSFELGISFVHLCLTPTTYLPKMHYYVLHIYAKFCWTR